MQSFGSQIWDAAFAVQAILSCNLNAEYGPTLRKAYEFMNASQVRISVKYSLDAFLTDDGRNIITSFFFVKLIMSFSGP